MKSRVPSNETNTSVTPDYEMTPNSILEFPVPITRQPKPGKHVSKAQF